ncbi:glucoamylase family protein [Streptomyces sp. NPDC048172]|uniref:glucoamylase family protein n=1 Tax=Streptomyces sp. NPDC048172 TaxID=3365505 RepID=UPI00370FDAE1
MRRRTFLTATAGAAALTTGVGAAPAGAVTARDPRHSRLLTWFRDTHRSIETMTTRFGLTADNLDLSGPAPVLSKVTSPTNIGCGLWTTVAAAGLGILGDEEATARLERTVAAVEKLERHHGFWLNWYDPEDGSTVTVWPATGEKVRPFLSSVDNAWLVTGLRIAADAAPSLRARIGALLDGADWSFFYTPYDAEDPVKGPGQLRGGFWTDKDEWTSHHYGALNTEPRMASYLGIADGSLPTDHYWHVSRTLLPGAEQSQKPGGHHVTVDGVKVWQGHYTYRGRKLVPTWGGSMFEALMVPLFVPEAEWSPRSWGRTHARYVRSQIAHGMDEAGYGYWGFSPANIPEGGYSEYGVDPIGMLKDGYTSKGVVTPHASFLALPFAEREALANLRALEEDFGAYDPGYGFRDSVNVRTGRVSDFVLALDQGMIAAALAQRLSPGLLRRPFRRDGFAARVKPLLRKEAFSI